MTSPIWRRRVVLRLERRGVPSQVIRPVVGSSIRLTMRSVVVLPHPDGPTITVILPEGTMRLRSTTATVPSRYVLPTDSNSITPTPQVPPNSLYDPSRHHRQLRHAGTESPLAPMNRRLSRAW